MSSGPWVLVIEDDADVRELIAERLRVTGYRVQCAATGEEGVARTKPEAPRLVILDILLPGIDGWEALREIRADQPPAPSRRSSCPSWTPATLRSRRTWTPTS
jgi:CheY-like chemotaxis protein